VGSTAAVRLATLLLELAFRDSSDTGDLHFAALTLRTMCEEIERQRVLDIEDRRFVELAVSNWSNDQEQFAKILECANSSLAPLEKDFLNAPNSDGNIDKSRADTGTRQSSVSLNDYVHPRIMGARL
jgi:hypothetical protein